MAQLASCTQQKAGGSGRISALNRWKMRPNTQGCPLTSLGRPWHACIHTMHVYTTQTYNEMLAKTGENQNPHPLKIGT